MGTKLVGTELVGTELVGTELVGDDRWSSLPKPPKPTPKGQLDGWPFLPTPGRQTAYFMR